MNTFFKKITQSIFLMCLVFLLQTTFLYSAESTSTSYTITNSGFGAGNQMNSTNFSVSGSLSPYSFGLWNTNSLPLAPGTITSCGKISTPGTYTLTSNLSGISGTCFIVLANNVTIEGAGHTITAVSGNTNYAVVATSSVANGGSGYSTTTIQNIIFTNFSGGVNTNGNNSATGAGGNGGTVVVASSTLGTISATGGSGSTAGNGGVGGNISLLHSTTGSVTTSGLTNGTIHISDTDLNISNNTYIANTLNLTYSGTFTTTSTTLSALTHLVINTNDLGSYVGGGFPLIPGTLTSCGTLYFAGTYTLSGDTTGNCNIAHSGVILAGATGGIQKILTGNVSANNYGVTLSNLTVTGAVSTTGATPGALVLNNASNLTGTVSVTGVINGDGSSSLGNTTINTGGSVATSSVSFVGDVLNGGTINSGNTVLGKTTNNGTINGDFVFNASSTNSGTVNGNAVLNDSSSNIGTITGTARFNMYTASGGAVTFFGTTAFVGTGYVTGNIYDTTNAQITSWVFNASSTNTGILKGNAVFNDTSSNILSGTVQGNATFNNTSINLGTVTGNSTVNSPVVRPLGGTTNGQVIYYGYAGLYFNDTVVGHGVVGKWDDINNWWTNALFTTHSPVIPTSGDNVLIYSSITNTATTAFVRSATFQNSTDNGITLIVSATSTDAVIFNASSTNSGTIIGNATFAGPDTENLGTVTGYITRQYDAGVFVVLRDFTHNGVYWIVQAINGASVNLSGATYSLVYNTFQALNNGFFFAWNSAISLGASGNPNLVITSPVTGVNGKWAPIISWGTATLCQYKIDGGSYTSVVCANNGSDIPRPNAGSHTVFFKASAGNNITEKSVVFTYDNTVVVDTDCSSPLDESTRPYYYLTQNASSCTITASTTLRGDNNGGGSYFTVGSITGNGAHVNLTNITATGTVSNFNNITLASSTLSGALVVNGTLTSDTKSRIGNTTLQSGGQITGGTFTGNLTVNAGGTITNSTTTPVTVAHVVTNNGTINGDFVFNATSTNYGTVNGNATLNDSAVNAGTINGNLIYNTLLSSYGAVTFSGNTIFPGTGTVTGSIKDYQGNTISKWIFNDDTENTGVTRGGGFFNEASTNSGTVNGNAYFSDTSLNAGIVTGNADVYYSVTVPLSGTVNGTIAYHSYPNAPSFTNQTGDYNWSTISNWFTDTTLSIPLGRTPITGENIVLFASTTLPSNLTNNIFFAVSSSTLDGAGYTVNGNISGNGAYGGHDAYSFNLQNITVTGTTTANGGDGTPSIDGGKGGMITVATSSTGVITVNGGDPQHNGGDAGSAVVTNSYAVQDGTPLLAVGGDSSGCGFGGSGGNITLIDSSGYVLINGAGADATVSCGGNPPTGSSGQSGRVVISGTYMSPSARAAAALAAANANRPSIVPSSVARIFANLQTIFLPVNNVGKLTLPTLPSFGSDTKGSFSFITPIENFLFKFFTDPISTLKIAEKPSPLLKSFLARQGIATEQAIAALNVTPKRIINTDTPGLFSVRGFTTKLTGDAKNLVYQKVTVQANKEITISLIPTDTKPIKASFNGKTLMFDDRNTITIVTPSKPGTYFLKTASSPIPLALVVVAPAAVSTSEEIKAKPVTLWNKVVGFFKSFMLK